MKRGKRRKETGKENLEKKRKKQKKKKRKESKKHCGKDNGSNPSLKPTISNGTFSSSETLEHSESMPLWQQQTSSQKFLWAVLVILCSGLAQM